MRFFECLCHFSSWLRIRPGFRRRCAAGSALLLLVAASAAGAATAGIDRAAPAPTPAPILAETLLPNDLLEVRVFEHPQLDMRLRVDLDYTISFPMCGTFSVRNLRPGEVAQQLTTRLVAAKLQRAQAIVHVVEYAPRYVYVFGEVANSGSSSAIALPPGSQMTAMQAISGAGGYAETADLRQVFIQRQQQQSGKPPLIIDLDVAAIINREPGAADVQLQVGDMVVVPAAKPITVMGQVQRAGTFYLPQTVELTVTQAVAMAQGLSSLANQSAVLLVRNGQVTPLDLSRMLRRGGDLSLDSVLQPGDMVYVSESRW